MSNAAVWRKTPLSELTDPDTPITYGVVKPGPEDPDGVLFIRGGDIANGRVLTEQLRTITRKVSEQYRRTQLRGGEIVVSLVGNPGQVAIIPDSLKGANIARQAGLVRLRDGVDARFVKYFLSSSIGQEALGAHSLGSVQQVINLRDLKTIQIPTPPLDEQRAIAHILGTLDDKIDLNRRMNETLEAMARALFKSWFVDFDPVRAKAERRDPGLPKPLADLFPDSFEDSELDEIPKGWKLGRLDEVTGFLGGYAFKSKDWIEQGTPVVKIGSVKPGIVDLSAVSYVSDNVAEEAKRFRLAPGDLLIGMTGYVGEVGLVPPADDPPLLNQRVGKFVLEKPGTAALAYLYCLTRQPEFKAQVETKSHGTAQANVSAEGILSIRIVVPPKALRDQFNRIAQPLIDRILANHAESVGLATQRDTLLPKLISGDLRIENPERVVNVAPGQVTGK